MPNLSEQAIQKLRRMRTLPVGTMVICDEFLTGVIDGETVNGRAIVALDMPIPFPGVDRMLERASFPWAGVRELK